MMMRFLLSAEERCRLLPPCRRADLFSPGADAAGFTQLSAMMAAPMPPPSRACRVAGRCTRSMIFSDDTRFAGVADAFLMQSASRMPLIFSLI